MKKLIRGCVLMSILAALGWCYRGPLVRMKPAYGSARLYAVLPDLPCLWFPDIRAVIKTAFTPFNPLGSGVLTSLAAVLLLVTMGRIIGATGILVGIF